MSDTHDGTGDGTRRCTWCGDALTGKRSDAKYCSKACRQAVYRKRKEQEIERLRQQAARPTLWQRLRRWLGGDA